MILTILSAVTMSASLLKPATTNPGIHVSREEAPDLTEAEDVKAVPDLTSNNIKANEQHFYLKH
jgi:hypothetical protein